jgi:hypothetical protein
MLSKRVIVVAGDKPFQKRLVAGAMAAGGNVQAFATADDLPANIEADLLLYSMGWSVQDPTYTGLLARLPPYCRVIPILPAPQLESMVRLLGDDRIASVLVAEEMTAQSISSTVSKLLYGDLFGLEKVMPWGVRIYSMLVGDYQEKSLAIAAIGDFAAAMGVRRKFREQIDQCMDEMLMNALYDAPVDADGKPLFAEVPVKERVTLKVEEKAVVQYGCDGERFVVSVRDSFGSLEKRTVLQYLDKCLHAGGAEQIDRKAGGAGLGLYLIANAATEVNFHIFAGRATEAVALFDLTLQRSQLRSFGIYEEHLITSAHPGVPSASGIRTLQRQGRRREDIAPTPPQKSGSMLPVMMALSILLLFTAVGLAALPYLRRPAQAALHVESEPPGATLYVDGRSRGITPLDVTDLEAGKQYAVRATMKGHADDDQLVVAQAGSATMRMHLGALAGVVAVDCDPPGAKVSVDGKERGLAPTTLELEPGKTYQIALHKDGYKDHSMAVTAPAPGERVSYRPSLGLSPDVAGITVAVDPPQASVMIDGLALMPPSATHDEFVKPGALHHVKVTMPGYIDFREDLLLGGGEHKTVRVKLALGGVLTLKTNVAAKVLIDDKAVGTAPLAPLALAEGKHTLTLRADKPYLRYTKTVQVETGKTVEERLDFGTVEIKASGVTAVGEGGSPVTLLQLPAGPQKLALANAQGEKKEEEVVVSPGRRVVIDHW